MSFFSLLLQYGISGVMAGTLVSYLLASLVAGRLLKVFPVAWYRFFLLISASFFFAICFEIIANGAYKMIFSQPLWEYKIYPSHGGSTSILGMFFWPLYGVYLYFLHQAFKVRSWHAAAHWKKGLLAGLDGPIIEIILNAFFLLVHGTFFFFYFPSDIFHFTTLQIVPVYAVGGVILTYAIHYLEQIKKNWFLPVTLYLLGTYIVAFL
jgi:hypothetical protein